MRRLLIIAFCLVSGIVHSQQSNDVNEADWRTFVQIVNDESPQAKQLRQLFRTDQRFRSFLVSVLGDSQYAVVAARPLRGCSRNWVDGDADDIVPLPAPDLELCPAYVVAIADGKLNPISPIEMCSRVDGTGQPMLTKGRIAMAALTQRFVNIAVREVGGEAQCFASVEVRR